MNQELAKINEGLIGIGTSKIEMSALRLEPVANVNVASGQLSSFTTIEPKEAFELEPEFDGNAKEIMR